MYFTIRQEPQDEQITWEDLILGNDHKIKWNQASRYTGTITKVVPYVKDDILKKANINRLIELFDNFNKKHEALFSIPRESLYRTFKIPKKKGGFRTINAPNEALSQALYELKHILENECGALYHTSAFAYVKGRSTVNAVAKHQKNESNWFLKLDFSDFFGSISHDFMMNMIGKLFPFSYLRAFTDGNCVEKALSLCFLNGGLPQGTPISPMLTNLIMIPIDHAIFNRLASRRFVYTRYADDMLISCIQAFNAKEMENEICNILKEFNAPLKINADKTRYGSRKGSNWNLGLMLNKENKITVGHMKKKYFKAAICSFILDHLNNNPWHLEDVQHLSGVMSYYRSIEPEYFKYIVEHNNHKFNCNLEEILKDRISLG